MPPAPPNKQQILQTKTRLETDLRGLTNIVNAIIMATLKTPIWAQGTRLGEHRAFLNVSLEVRAIRMAHANKNQPNKNRIFRFLFWVAGHQLLKKIKNFYLSK